MHAMSEIARFSMVGLDTLKSFSLLSNRMAAESAGLWKSLIEPFVPFMPKSAARGGLEAMIQAVDNWQEFSVQSTATPNQPVLDIKNKTVWQDSLVELKEVSGTEGIPVVIYLPIMRGPFLAFYTEDGKKTKSVGKALMGHGAFKVYYTDWKPLDDKTKRSGIEDYAYGTYHGIGSFINHRDKRPPVCIYLCQPGYFGALNLAKYPDDASVAVFVASPHGAVSRDSKLYPIMECTTRQDVEAEIRANKGVIPGKAIAGAWEMMSFADICSRYTCRDEIETARGIIQGSFNSKRRKTFRDWLYMDTRDVPGKAMLEIFELIFKEAVMEKDSPLGYSQRNYTNPALAVWGEKDDIVTRSMSLSVLDRVGSVVRESYGVPGGHAAVFSGTASIKVWRDIIIPRIYELSQPKQVQKIY